MVSYGCLLARVANGQYSAQRHRSEIIHIYFSILVCLQSLDYLAIGVHELASMSERRLERLVNPAYSELPAFLADHGGLNSGFMIAHCTAAALGMVYLVLVQCSYFLLLFNFSVCQSHFGHLFVLLFSLVIVRTGLIMTSQVI